MYQTSCKHWILLCCLVLAANVSLFGQKKDAQLEFLELEKKMARGNISSDLISSYTYINIDSQESFDNMYSLIISALKKANDVVVYVKPGRYYFKEQHLYFYNQDFHNSTVRIIGTNATIVSTGTDYLTGESPYKGDCSVIEKAFLTNNYELATCYEPYRSSDTLVEVLNASTKSCRLKISSAYKFSNDMYIQIPHWFQVSRYKIDKIEKGYAYFTANDLEWIDWKKNYNLNDDNHYAHQKTRYAIYNAVAENKVYIADNRVHVPKSYNSIHECEASQFLCIYKSSFKKFEISGLNFIGSNSKYSCLIYFIESKFGEGALVKDCSFRFLCNSAVHAVAASNVSFIGNTVKTCISKALFSDNKSSNIKVSNNKFLDFGFGNTPCIAVTCYGCDYEICNNTFVDVNYNSIFVGLNYHNTIEYPCRGIVEHNEIYFSDEFLLDYKNRTFIDCGAIYVATQNNPAIIRYNYIHDIAGVGYYRAIYCDDGAQNVKIYGNLIRDIIGDYSVFSWRASGADKNVPKANDGISFMYNAIFGNYKFDERQNSSCVHGKNVIINNPEAQCILNNFQSQEDDIFIDDVKVKRGKIRMSLKNKKVLKQLPTYSEIKKWF